MEAQVGLKPRQSGQAALVDIASDSDIVSARRYCRELCAGIGFSSTDLTVIATAVSEITRNILEYAQRGTISFEVIHQGSRNGISIIAQDQGPGIPDIARAMQDGYSTSNGLGLGLPGSKRLMDEFALDSEAGKGTTITMKKWVI